MLEATAPALSTLNEFNKEKQLASYEKITANIDGTCGEKVHDFICNQFR